MRSESAALEADWATRNPVAADFEVMAEATDPDDTQRFALVVPSFRGEVLVAGLLGSFSSEDPMSVFDRDADDAIALLDCTVQNFPQADPNLALSTGWSRGARSRCGSPNGIPGFAA